MDPEFLQNIYRSVLSENDVRSELFRGLLNGEFSEVMIRWNPDAHEPHNSFALRRYVDESGRELISIREEEVRLYQDNDQAIADRDINYHLRFEVRVISGVR